MDAIQVGPDINPTKTPLDKKLYRQILLPNGLRVVLISDTVALHQEKYFEDDEDSSDEDQSQEDGNKDKDDDVNMTTDEKEEKMDIDEIEEEDFDEDDDDEEDDDGLRKAAAALIVGAGSFHDPPCAHGLAHYLEHMLFMGSEKYPGENEYDSFLSKNSGGDNAYTECEHTMYHLEVCQEKIFKALDMLAQFFISPLMLQDAVERELNSIESEFQLSKNSDECRMQQLLCHFCAQQKDVMQKESGETTAGNHPFSNFSWGNIQSLKHTPEKNGIDMMKELRKFYNQHYYAQNMGLVVIGGYTLDELQKHVVKSFSDIPAMPRVDFMSEEDNQFYDTLAIQRENAGTWDQTSHTPIKNFGMPFNTDSLVHISRIVPVKDKHNLTITWQVPPQYDHWKSKPIDYIAHLLGHEAKGSLLSALKEKSWVNECYAGVGSGGYENASSHALFCFTLNLSESGVSHWAEIVSQIYVYIGMIRYYCNLQDGLPMWIYEELRAVQEVSYKFDDEAAPMDLVENIAENLTPYNALPPERLLDGNALLFEFDGDAVKNLVDNHLTPSNARVDLMSSSFGRAADFEVEECNMSVEDGQTFENSKQTEDNVTSFSLAIAGRPNVEPIFGTRYWSNRIPTDLIDEWSKAAEPQLPPLESPITLPPVNPFIPKNFDLKALPPDDSHHPLLFCSLKLCISVGKKKAWFPCTVNKFDGTKNRVLLSYEDEDEKWHKVDLDFKDVTIFPNFEGTFDSKAIKYKVIAVPEEGEGAVLKYGDESDWHVEDGLHFPHIPPLLPESRLPQLVTNTKLLKLWHFQDRKFKRPIAELRLKMSCLRANKSPLYKACAELFTFLIHDRNTETCYLASVCELGSSLSATDFGFTARINGFDDKLLELTAEILKVIFSFNTTDAELPLGIKKSRFDSCLEVLIRKYNNVGMRASSLCSDVRLRCIRPTIWSAAAKTEAIKDITTAKFMEVISDLLKNISIEGLYMGNVHKKDAEATIKLILNLASASTGIAKNKHPKQEVLIVPPQKEFYRVIVPTIDPKEPNTAVEIYIQCGKDDIEKRVVIDLLVQILNEPLFDKLRTKEQLGYQVSCGTRWTFGVMGISFKVVTTCKSAHEVNERIDSFLTEFKAELDAMNKETFMENSCGLAKTKLEKFNSLEEEAGSLWYEIVEGRYDWEVSRNEAYALRSVTKDQISKAFDDWLCPKKSSCRRLTVHAIGTKEGPASMNRPLLPTDTIGHAIDERVEEFRKSTGNKTWGKIW